MNVTLPLGVLHHSHQNSHFDPRPPQRPRRLQVHNKLVRPLPPCCTPDPVPRHHGTSISQHTRTPRGKVTNPFVWRRPFC